MTAIVAAESATQLGADVRGVVLPVGSHGGVLATRGIPAAAVDGMTARIGDARSLWATGVIAHLNAPALSRGARAGTSAQAFATLATGSA